MRATLIRRIRSHGVREATSSCRATTTEFPRCLAQQNWKSEFISSRVGPRHGANSGGGNEPRFRLAGEVKNIVYENRGVFDKFIIL